METLRAIVKTKDLRTKCILVLIILLICRVLANIPTPGVNSEYFREILENNASLGLFNIITGGGLTSLSIMALGITPYITASIVLQLLGTFIPRLHEIQKSPAQTDKKQLRAITFYVGGGLALFEALMMAIGFGRTGMLQNYTWYNILLTVIIWTVGALFLIIMGELINARLVGNGISLILAMNIIVSFPSDINSIWNVIIHNGSITMQITKGILVIAFFLAIIAFIVILNQTTRNIPVVTSRKIKGSADFAQNQKYDIPLKLCQGGVIPVVFAASLLSFPALIMSFMGKTGTNWFFMLCNSSNWFNTARPIYSLGAIIYIALIFLFSYFYIDVGTNPNEIAENLQKAGSTIPGIRPGKPTAEYIEKQMRTTTLIGATGLSIVAIIPYIIGGLFGLSNLSILGTSLIIVVGVIIETKLLLESLTKGSLYRERVHKGGIFNYARN